MRRVKITNVQKFIRSITILLGIILLMIIFLSKASFSHNNKEVIEYKTLSIIDGDTLWNIASNEQESNPYYEGKDVREVIYDIKKVNNLGNTYLTVGEVLKIPTI